MQPSRETWRRKGKLSAILVMAMQPSMDRFSSRVNVSNATTCASATAPRSGGGSSCLEVMTNQHGAILMCASTCLTGQETSIDIAQSCIACLHAQ